MTVLADILKALAIVVVTIAAFGAAGLLAFVG
jgi:hypothetical protein